MEIQKMGNRRKRNAIGSREVKKSKANKPKTVGKSNNEETKGRESDQERLRGAIDEISRFTEMGGFKSGEMTVRTNWSKFTGKQSDNIERVER